MNFETFCFDQIKYGTKCQIVLENIVTSWIMLIPFCSFYVGAVGGPTWQGRRRRRRRPVGRSRVPVPDHAHLRSHPGLGQGPQVDGAVLRADARTGGEPRAARPHTVHAQGRDRSATGRMDTAQGGPSRGTGAH